MATSDDVTSDDMGRTAPPPLAPIQGTGPEGAAPASSSGPVVDDGEQTPPPPAPTDAFRRGQKVDLLDTQNKWYKAIIEYVDHENCRVFAHFEHWGSQWDEWIAVPSERIQPPGTRCYRPPHPMRIGMLVECFDADRRVNRWERCVVVDESADRVKVHYHRFSAQFDEWVDRSSPRLAPWGAHTRKIRPFQPPKELYWLEHRREATLVSGDARYQQFAAALGGRGLAIVSAVGDGNCLFRSVAHQVYGTQEVHAVVRQRCVEYMDVEREYFQGFVVGGEEEFRQYLQQLARNGTWGDDPEVQALCELYGRPAEVWVHDPRAGARNLRTFNSQAVPRTGIPPIRLSFYGGGHYDSVAPASPAVHRRACLDPLQAGSMEAQVIASVKRARQRGQARSAAQGAEDEQLRQALRASRDSFELEETVDQLLLASLGVEAQQALRAVGATGGGGGAAAASGGGAGGAGLEQRLVDAAMTASSRQDTEAAQVQAAMAASLQQHDESDEMARALEASRQQLQPSAEDDLERALRESRAAVTTPDDEVARAIAASLSSAAAPTTLSAEEQMRLALEASLREAPGLAAGAAAQGGVDDSDADLQMAMEASLAAAAAAPVGGAGAAAAGGGGGGGGGGGNGGGREAGAAPPGSDLDAEAETASEELQRALLLSMEGEGGKTGES